jgi:hypothetical protein
MDGEGCTVLAVFDIVDKAVCDEQFVDHFCHELGVRYMLNINERLLLEHCTGIIRM